MTCNMSGGHKRQALPCSRLRRAVQRQRLAYEAHVHRIERRIRLVQVLAVIPRVLKAPPHDLVLEAAVPNRGISARPRVQAREKEVGFVSGGVVRLNSLRQSRRHVDRATHVPEV